MLFNFKDHYIALITLYTHYMGVYQHILVYMIWECPYGSKGNLRWREFYLPYSSKKRSEG